jgi:hypothetical protein
LARSQEPLDQIAGATKVSAKENRLLPVPFRGIFTHAMQCGTIKPQRPITANANTLILLPLSEA